MPSSDLPSPPPTNAEADFEAPLRVEGFQGTPEEVEQQWFEQVYRGRGDTMAQLTVRAVLMGMALGGVLSLTNLYIGLKAGWTLGVTITACVVSYTLWSVFLRLGLAKTRMTILENNCMQSTACAAGASTGTTLVSAFSAYFMINNTALPYGLTLAWVFFMAVLGVTMAIPMKRQMINIEQLRFPTGIASAETLRALYSKGRQSVQTARALTYAGVIAALSQFWTDGLRLVSARLEPFGLGSLLARFDQAFFGAAWIGRTVTLVWDPIFIAAGVLMGLRSAASIFLGSMLCWVVFVPIMQAQGVITQSSYRDVVQWTLWGGVSCMVVAGLLAFGLQWRSIARAFRSIGRFFGGIKAAPTAMDAIETPMAWFFIAQGISLVALSWLAKVSFNMPVWESTVAVGLSFFLALVACRVCGETDTTPIGPMGKVTQLVFGALNPGNMNINLMSANITSSAAAASSDLLTDLKSGYLLGANPRKQFLAQFSGIFIGTVVTVSAYRVMVPTASVLGSDQFPAPAAQTWRVVALALSHGFESLGPVKFWSIIVGALTGVLLTLLPRWFPRQAKWIPSPSGLGLAWTFHWYYGLLFFTGGLVGWFMERSNPARAKLYNNPVASGVIAGGSLMGVILIFWENIPIVWHQLFGG
jgi:putative OPT family oligopeptide transporter